MRFAIIFFAFFSIFNHPSHAVNLSFQFDVNSSGPSIYACNAGIKQVAESNICFNRITNLACSPGCAAGNLSQCSGGATPSNCVCTGESLNSGTQGTWRLNYLKASTSEWTDNQVASGSATNHMITANGSSSFAQISSGAFPVLAAYGRQINNMSINLGSEVYGAEYFVDICYRGPQINYRENGTNVPGVNFALKANATIFDIKLADGKSYRELSKLQVMAEARCIMNDTFDYCLADLLPGETSSCGTTTATAHTYGRVSNSGAFIDMSGNAINVAQLISDASMNSNGHFTPRFCQVRFTFKESSKTMRKWKSQQARICTYTEISEPAL
jgi:hypothetical protein